jgi:mannose/fructose/N-acetylgalactosamine-specific phosphotransferase system component IIB
LPACTTIGNDFLTVNSLVTNTPFELEKFIGNSLMHGKKNIMVKLKNVKDTDSIIDKVVDIAHQQYGNIYKCNARVEVSCNPSQLVFEINFV